MVNFWSSNHILEIYNFGFFVFVLTIQSFFLLRNWVLERLLKMDSFKLMVIFALLAMAAISRDLLLGIFLFKVYFSFILYNFLCPPIFFWLLVEADIFVQAAKPICGPDCNGTFSFKECYNHCVELGYKNGFCILSEPVRYRCCCPSKWSNMLCLKVSEKMCCVL